MIGCIINALAEFINNKYVKILFSFILGTSFAILLFIDLTAFIFILFILYLTAIIYFEFFNGD